MNTLCNYDVILQVRLTEVRLTEDVLTLHHMVRRLTPQPQLTEVTYAYNFFKIIKLNKNLLVQLSFKKV